MKEINTVTVIGASGSMGANVSAIFASFGNAKVYMVSRQKSDKTLEKAVKSVRSDSIRKNLFLADYSELSQCVSKSDLIFESVVEDVKIKNEVNALIVKYLKKDSIFVTGTSGLSVTKMVNLMPENIRNRYFGMHMFNPPYSLSLCELIKTPYVDEKLILDVKEYLETKLLRSVVIVKDEPAFLANRIGFYFINRALQYAEKYKEYGGIDYIESILGKFTGRAMTPCLTADFVGLDVHKSILDNLYQNTSDYENNAFKVPTFVEKLVSEGKLGKKSGEGLFKTVSFDDGTKHTLVYDVLDGSYREKRNYYFNFAKKMNDALKDGNYELAFNELKNDNSQESKICLDFLKGYVEYSLFVAKEVSGDIKAADIAMATGFNWCPPLAMANVLFDGKYDTDFDFRSFFKADK